MSDLTQNLLVAFVAGFIVQRFLEIVDPFTTARIKNPNVKGSVMGLLSIFIGWLLAHYVPVEIFKALGQTMTTGWDHVFSAIFISAGTEGFNSLMKFANYKKEATKADAASKKPQLSANES
jgi:hypothetical protein